MMPRIFLAQTVAVGDRITVAGEDGHHFARVLRARTGEQATVAAAAAGYLATITAVDKQAGSIEIVIEKPLKKRDPAHQVYVVQAMAKADKVDTVIQKCTEVGAAGVILYESERSVVKLKKDKIAGKLERWKKVAKEGAVQCQRDTIPVIEHAATFAGVLEWIGQLQHARVLLLDEGESVYGLRTALHRIRTDGTDGTVVDADRSDDGERITTAQPEQLVIVTGPEGGWSDEERAQWTENNAAAVTLGPRILRTETAGVAALTAILYEFGDLGG